LTWAQRRLGKEYLLAGKLRGKDIASSRAPQRYGIQTIEELVEAALELNPGSTHRD
jgi:hypothetical protein